MALLMPVVYNEKSIGPRLTKQNCSNGFTAVTLHFQSNDLPCVQTDYHYIAQL